MSVGEYRKYLQEYTFPQMEGWIEEQVLQTYSIYLTRYPAGRKWTALLVLEYKNDAALAQRPAVQTKVRERLAKIPSWKAISDNKQSIREEGQVVVADQVAP